MHSIYIQLLVIGGRLNLKLHPFTLKSVHNYAPLKITTFLKHMKMHYNIIIHIIDFTIRHNSKCIQIRPVHIINKQTHLSLHNNYVIYMFEILEVIKDKKVNMCTFYYIILNCFV